MPCKGIPGEGLWQLERKAAGHSGYAPVLFPVQQIMSLKSGLADWSESGLPEPKSLSMDIVRMSFV